MNRLSQSTLANLPDVVSAPGYPRQQTDCGIVHIGVGNFHRAHQAVYCDDLLSAGENMWGITGVSLRSARTRDALAAQDFLYTLVESDKSTNYRIIGSIQEILAAPNETSACIDVLANEGTALITTTVSEKGYLLVDGEVDVTNVEYRSDLGAIEAPRTVYGYLAASIIRRVQRSNSPVSVLCCDNLNFGGAVLREGTMELLTRHDAEAARWAADNVSFLSSVVDRVTPTTTAKLIRDTSAATGLHDAWPVATEPTCQWVIENEFSAARPPFDQVGAMYVSDVGSYARMKLAVLNAAHSIIAVLACLLNDEFIHQALTRKYLRDCVRSLMVHEICCVTEFPPSVDGIDYVGQVLSRFRNSSLPYLAAQVCGDSSEKIQQRWFPTIDRLLERGESAIMFAFALSGWVAYIEIAISNGTLVDPHSERLKQVIGKFDDVESRVRSVLDVAGASNWQFADNTAFMNCVYSGYRQIGENGAAKEISKRIDQGQDSAAGHA